MELESKNSCRCCRRLFQNPSVLSKDYTTQVNKVLLNYFSVMYSQTDEQIRANVIRTGASFSPFCEACLTIAKSSITLNNKLEKIKSKIDNLLFEYNAQLLEYRNLNPTDAKEFPQSHQTSARVENSLSEQINVGTKTEVLLEVKQENEDSDAFLNNYDDFTCENNMGMELSALLPSSTFVIDHDGENTDQGEDDEIVANSLTQNEVEVPLQRFAASPASPFVAVTSRRTGVNKRVKSRRRESQRFSKRIRSSERNKVKKLAEAKQKVQKATKTVKKKQKKDNNQEEEMVDITPAEDSYDNETPAEDTKRRSKKPRTEFKCGPCDLYFPTKELLNVHLGGSVNCRFCGRYFLTHSARYTHTSKYHWTSGKTFQCKICQAVFKNRYDLEYHGMTHTGEVPYKCQSCQEQFSNLEDYMYHQQMSVCPISYSPGSTSDNVPFLQCDMCDMSFKTKYMLLTHTAVNHNKPLIGFLCGVCGDKKLDTAELISHLISVHTHEDPYYCDICGKPSRSAGILKHHRESHLGVKTFQCDFCDMRFNQKGTSLRRHVQAVHIADVPILKCDVCLREFKIPTDFKRHVATHFKTIICDICGKAYNRNIDLKTHMRTHTGEMFPCATCKKEFVSPYLRNKHITACHIDG